MPRVPLCGCEDELLGLDDPSVFNLQAQLCQPCPLPGMLARFVLFCPQVPARNCPTPYQCMRGSFPQTLQILSECRGRLHLTKSY